MKSAELGLPAWKASGDYEDISYETAEGIAKVTICRPEVRNAFRPRTVVELSHAFDIARDDPDVGVVILTGKGTEAFCSGGDQKVRGDDGYLGDDPVGARGIGRLNVLDLQVQIRRLPKPVVAMVAGYAIGGGHVLHLVCDLTIAADDAASARTAHGSAASTPDTARACSPARSARNARRRSGSSAATTTRRAPSRWGS